MTDPDVKALTEAYARLRERGLRMREQDMDDPEFASRALALIEDPDVPQFATHADGTRAEPPFTPRQAWALTEPRYRPVTHVERAYKVALAAIREELGRLPSAGCTGTTRDGAACGTHALSYMPPAAVTAQEPRACLHHSPPPTRDYNAAMRTLEDTALTAALRELSQETPA